jgi:hypothetical protein
MSANVVLCLVVLSTDPSNVLSGYHFRPHEAVRPSVAPSFTSLFLALLVYTTTVPRRWRLAFWQNYRTRV